MKKLLAILVIAIILVISMCACGAKSDMFDRTLGAENMYSFDEKSNEYYDGAVEYDAKELDQNAAPAEFVKKIIKDAKVDMTAGDVKETYGKVISFVKENGGYEFSQTTDTGSGYTVIEAKLKIPGEKLDALVEYIGKCGDVINCNVNSNDITDQYYDTDIRLKTKKASLEQYYKMLGEARSVDDIIAVQRTIDSLTEEIEALEGKLNMWNKQVAESTVVLYIRQADDPIKIVKHIKWNALSFSDMGTLILNGLVSVLNIIVSALQWLVIIIAVMSPVIIAAGVVVFVVFRKRKKK